MGLPIQFSVDGTVTMARDNIAAAQSLAGAGNLTINGVLASGGVATVAPAGQESSVAVYSAGDDTGLVFTAYGYNAFGNPISASVAGASADRNSFPINFYQVTRVSSSGATAGNVEVGSVNAYSRPIGLNYHAQPFQLSVSCIVTGTVNFDLQYTLDELNTWPARTPTWLTQSDFNDKTANTSSLINAPIAFARLLLNSGSGSVDATALQAGLVGG